MSPSEHRAQTVAEEDPAGVDPSPAQPAWPIGALGLLGLFSALIYARIKSRRGKRQQRVGARRLN